jgi:hypothetical protein
MDYDDIRPFQNSNHSLLSLPCQVLLLFVANKSVSNMFKDRSIDVVFMFLFEIFFPSISLRRRRTRVHAQYREREREREKRNDGQLRLDEKQGKSHVVIS